MLPAFVHNGPFFEVVSENNTGVVYAKTFASLADARDVIRRKAFLNDPFIGFRTTVRQVGRQSYIVVADNGFELCEAPNTNWLTEGF